jgi:hypothetical protein
MKKAGSIHVEVVYEILLLCQSMWWDTEKSRRLFDYVESSNVGIGKFFIISADCVSAIVFDLKRCAMKLRIKKIAILWHSGGCWLLFSEFQDVYEAQNQLLQKKKRKVYN